MRLARTVRFGPVAFGKRVTRNDFFGTGPPRPELAQ